MDAAMSPLGVAHKKNRGQMMRSKLFVPGSRPELFAKALASKADAVSFDLEDAVDPSAKDSARQQLVDFLGTLEPSEKIVVVRINETASVHYERDLKALVGTAMQVVNLPKVESAEQIEALARRLEQLEAAHGMTSPIAILATIESPKGLRNAAAIAAASPRVNGLQLGLADLLEPLGIDRNDPWTLHQIRLSLRLAAGEAGVATYDSAFARVNDPEGFAAEAKTARQLGYAGKSCIHPSQIEWANRAFVPDAEQIAHALRVVEAAAKAEAAGIGAYMVDGPFVRSARALLLQARSAGLVS
jgi:citrate lyase subunit beta/citryl-CoA lyase